MKYEAILKYLSINGELRPAEETSVFDRIGGGAIYEVVKLIDGVPLFFEDHMARMRRSAALLEASLNKPESEILQEIDRLVAENGCRNINVKMVSARSGGEDLFLVYFIRSEYPGPEVYARGVHTIPFPGERPNPHVKTIEGSFRSRVEQALRKTKAYEALLIDEEGRITEGSRSNIFFLGEGGVHTPPAGTVLLGVTRGQVMDICEALAIPASEQPLRMDELDRLRGAFITGTTVDVLPVASIGDLKLASVEAAEIRSIIGAYRRKVREYIRRRGGDPTRIDSGSGRSRPPDTPPGCPD